MIDETNMLEDEAPERSAWPPVQRSPATELIPPFHGAVFYDMATEEAVSAWMPLHLPMRLCWKLWVWYKAGPLAVPADPHEAFFHGQMAGERELRQNLPRDLLLRERAVLAREQAMDAKQPG